MEVVMSLPAGTRDSSGAFPAGSINGLVEERLCTLARQARAFRMPAEEPGSMQLPAASHRQ
jgi:hypothetical protein